MGLGDAIQKGANVWDIVPLDVIPGFGTLASEGGAAGLYAIGGVVNVAEAAVKGENVVQALAGEAAGTAATALPGFEYGQFAGLDVAGMAKQKAREAVGGRASGDNAPNPSASVELKEEHRTRVAEMAEETASCLNKDDDAIKKSIEKNMREIGKIEDPDIKMAMLRDYNEITQLQMQVEASKDNKITEKEEKRIKEAQELFAKGMGEDGTPDQSAKNQKARQRGGIA